MRLAVGDWRLAGRAFGRFDRDGGFSGGVAALPGRYSHGETINELKDNIREAIVGVLEVMREHGQEPDANIQILDVAV